MFEKYHVSFMDKLLKNSLHLIFREFKSTYYYKTYSSKNLSGHELKMHIQGDLKYYSLFKLKIKKHM